jgi:hypothetical protein
MKVRGPHTHELDELMLGSGFFNMHVSELVVQELKRPSEEDRKSVV